MNYAEMSDFEINCAVASYLGKEFFYNSPGEEGRRRKSFVIDGRCRDIYENGTWSSDVFAPCKSWADAGPIIAENKITILTDETTDEWSAAVVQDFCDERAFKYSNCAENPLRAAMVTFLMMQEKTNA